MLVEHLNIAGQYVLDPIDAHYLSTESLRHVTSHAVADRLESSAIAFPRSQHRGIGPRIGRLPWRHPQLVQVLGQHEMPVVQQARPLCMAVGISHHHLLPIRRNKMKIDQMAGTGLGCKEEVTVAQVRQIDVGAQPATRHFGHRRRSP
ncbi:MAG: hypothetical protein D6753_14555 [Planctomycetota bacterium]|nr:MAG: hypothetical protein D6753_14555 [Planctomycetota bacterium]